MKRTNPAAEAALLRQVTQQIDCKIWPEFHPTVRNVRYVIRHYFGVSIRDDRTYAATDPAWQGACDIQDDGETVQATIRIRPGLPEVQQVKTLLHELAEFLAVRQAPSLYDTLPDPPTRLLFHGIDAPGDVRHRVAEQVVDHYSALWSLDALPAAGVNRIKIDVALVTAACWLMENPPPPELVHIKPEEEDFCL